MFKPGDKVRKKDGSKFFDGSRIGTIGQISGNVAWVEGVNNFITISKLEKVEEDKELTFKVGDLVKRKDGEKFLDGRKEVEVMEVIGTTVVLNGFISTHESKIEKVEEKSLEDTAYELGTKSIDNINPDHYKTGGIETIDYLKAKLTKEE
ncbi:MAG TPA: hypothetical protein VLA13_03680, partial [Massilibacterium sp.]|nr:hypothetical protein [Massilibacterium sp.]